MFRKNACRIIALALLSIALATSVGCATGKKPVNPIDPYETVNRKVFKFNNFFDKILFRPIAIVYRTIIPKPLQTGVKNFFSNINQITTIPNDFLQGNIKNMFANSWRLLFNTTIGIGGLFDVATPLGLPERKNDFGLTMAKWGVVKSPYMVTPFFGPTTARDGFGTLVDYNLLSPWPYIKPQSIRYSLVGTRLLSKRTALLGADKFIKESFDPYAFVRSAYLQYRQIQIDRVRGVSVDEELPDTYLSAATEAAEAENGEPLVAEPGAVNEPLVAEPMAEGESLVAKPNV